MLLWPRSSLKYLLWATPHLVSIPLLALHFSIRTISTSVGSYLICSIMFPPLSSLGFPLRFGFALFWAVALAPAVSSFTNIFSGRFLRRTPVLCMVSLLSATPSPSELSSPSRLFSETPLLRASSALLSLVASPLSYRFFELFVLSLISALHAIARQQWIGAILASHINTIQPFSCAWL